MSTELPKHSTVHLELMQYYTGPVRELKTDTVNQRQGRGKGRSSLGRQEKS